MQAEVVEVQLTGHLTAAQLREKLAAAGAVLETREVSSPVVVDCSAMEGYDLEARDSFVAWNITYRKRVTRVAIITDKIMWHMIIRAMALASRQAIRPFKSREAAAPWLAEE